MVAQQVRGTWDTKSATMAAYRAAVDEFARCFLGYEVRHIPRAQNEVADTLSRLGSERRKVPKDVFLEHLHKPSVKGADILDPDSVESVEVANYAVYLVKPDWTMPYLNFLTNKELPDDEVLRRQIVRRAKAFTIINGELYKRSTTGIYQRCISPDEGRNLLDEIHSGVCGHHASSRALVAKAFRQGFYWLTTKEDAEHIVKTCKIGRAHV